MTKDEKIEILKAREYQVVKHNDLVLKTRYDFSVNEQKTLAYVCSMIKPVSSIDRAKENPFILEYEFEIIDYIRVLGLEKTGKIYNEIKLILKGLRDKSIWITLEDGSETTVGWLSKVWTNKKSGKAKIRFDEDLVPYLFDLREKYLSYGLKNILCMKSQYGIRLYEIIKAYYELKIAQTDMRSKVEKGVDPKSISWTIDLEELKKQLMADTIKSYANYKDFRKYVLEISQKEINEMTDINVYFEPILKGRKTVKIKFTITSKTTIEQYLVEKKNDRELGEI
jgi:plasmid replication initiation protein